MIFVSRDLDPIHPIQEAAYLEFGITIDAINDCVDRQTGTVYHISAYNLPLSEIWPTTT